MLAASGKARKILSLSPPLAAATRKTLFRSFGIRSTVRNAMGTHRRTPVKMSTWSRAVCTHTRKYRRGLRCLDCCTRNAFANRLGKIPVVYLCLSLFFCSNVSTKRFFTACTCVRTVHVCVSSESISYADIQSDLILEIVSSSSLDEVSKTTRTSLFLKWV